MYDLIQDGDYYESFETLAKAAHHLYSIAEALEADATRIRRMAGAVLDGGESRWNYEGSYIQLAVENTEVQA